tara:strand:- start:19 stop:336 length:318 start_codon:yes stop_codon:yes gene_type:complete
MKKWSIKQLNRENDSGLVVSAIWEIGQAGTQEVLTGSSKFSKGESFIPFDQLTEEIVLNWVKSELGQNKIEALERAHDDQIAGLANVVVSPEIKAGLPWPQETTV